jgi:hypothetical protein
VDATSTKCREASTIGADGVVAHKTRDSRATTPSARAEEASRFLLIAQPPLLCKEGNGSPLIVCQFIHTFLAAVTNAFTERSDCYGLRIPRRRPSVPDRDCCPGICTRTVPILQSIET